MKENGVATAIQAIYRDMEYAKSLIKRRNTNADYDLGDEESWTFIGDEGDPELVRRIAEWDPMVRIGPGRASMDNRSTEPKGRKSMGGERVGMVE